MNEWEIMQGILTKLKAKLYLWWGISEFDCFFLTLCSHLICIFPTEVLCIWVRTTRLSALYWNLAATPLHSSCLQSHLSLLKATLWQGKDITHEIGIPTLPYIQVSFVNKMEIKITKVSRAVSYIDSFWRKEETWKELCWTLYKHQ